MHQNPTAETPQVCAIRWKIEPMHREVKQVTGLEPLMCGSLFGVQRGEL
ncbi:MAG: hypothetical protein M3R15_23730 [Acidobacteriota bacterium]|jgi:hypothetical protein|nr:hypothetical protein [Acidobacteriota bacterium]